MNGQVSLRDDDIYLTRSPRYGTVYYNFEKFKYVHRLLRGQEHYLAIIAAEIDSYPELTNYIIRNKKDFKFGVHGWTHKDYRREDKTDILQAKKKIENTFDVKVDWFFPPWNRSDEALVDHCRKIGLKCNTDYCQPPDFNKDICCFHYWNDDEVTIIEQWLIS